MSGLIHGIVINAKALNAHSASVETAGRNLANVNNPDYARQRVVLGNRGSGETDLGAQSFGVEAISIEQIRDVIIDQQMMREINARSSLEAQSQAAGWLESNLGEQINRQESLGEQGTESAMSTGLTKAISDFFNAYEAVSSRPDDDGEKQELLQQASILVERFNTIDNRLNTVSENIDSQIDQAVTDANTLIERIAEVNSEIERFELRRPGAAVDLRDQRQALVEDLSQLINIEVVDIPDSAGQIAIYAREAGTLASVELLSGEIISNRISFNGTDFQSTNTAVNLSVTGGQMHGYREIRDNALANTRSDLDALAAQIVAEVNTAYGTQPPADNFFDAAGLTAGTIALDSTLNLASLKTGAPGLAGDNQVALAVAGLQDQRFTNASFSGETFFEFMARVTTTVGTEVKSVQDRLTNQEVVEDLLRQQRQSISGVSLDEEMSDLLRFQRAFQATARVVSTMDRMLELVVTGLAR